MDCYLFAQEVRVSAQAPEAFGDEPAIGVGLGPVPVREGPGARIAFAAGVLVVLVGPLGVVGGELEEQRRDADPGEDVVRREERSSWL